MKSKAGSTVPPGSMQFDPRTERERDIAAGARARALDDLCDLSGKVVAEVGLMESIAIAANELPHCTGSSMCRRIRSLAVEAGVVARDAWETARELDTVIRAGAAGAKP